MYWCNPPTARAAALLPLHGNRFMSIFTARVRHQADAACWYTMEPITAAPMLSRRPVLPPTLCRSHAERGQQRLPLRSLPSMICPWTSASRCTMGGLSGNTYSEQVLHESVPGGCLYRGAIRAAFRHSREFAAILAGSHGDRHHGFSRRWARSSSSSSARPRQPISRSI